jgi:hypothetical protein
MFGMIEIEDCITLSRRCTDEGREKNPPLLVRRSKFVSWA